METKYILGILGALVGGAAIGSFVTYKVVGKKLGDEYEARYQEQVKDLKAHFTVPKVEKAVQDKKELAKKKAEKNVPAPAEKPTLVEMTKKLKAYTNYSNVEPEPAEEKYKGKPYVISPEEYGEETDYELEELTFYADGILANSFDEILNIDEYIGKESIKHIGDYEKDTLHIKNDGKKFYYEVLVDERSYLDVTDKTADEDYNLYRYLDKDDEENK